MLTQCLCSAVKLSIIITLGKTWGPKFERENINIHKYYILATLVDLTLNTYVILSCCFWCVERDLRVITDVTQVDIISIMRTTAHGFVVLDCVTIFSFIY